jgi:serine hydrolase
LRQAIPAPSAYKAAAGRARVLHAGDDPVTGAATGEHLMQFVTGLDATAIITSTGGHFPGIGEDCRSLPDAVDLIRSILDNHS